LVSGFALNNIKTNRMLQFKNEGLGTKKPDTSNALPNTFGKVRTFKEDLENFEKGLSPKDDLDDIDLSPSTANKPVIESPLAKQEMPQTMPATPAAEPFSKNPFQSVPTPPPIPVPNSVLPSFKSSPSQSFFGGNPPAKPNSLPEIQEEQVVPQKKKRGLTLLIIILLLAIGGAGFYYYWFYIQNNSSLFSFFSAPAASTPETPPASSTTPATSQNKNLRNLVVDASQGPAEIKDVVQKFTTEFSASASESDLIEVKLVGKNNQPIGKKEFFSGIGATIPDAVLMKLSEDYSLFTRKEGGVAKLGFVFKTVTSSGLADEMKKWEPTLKNDLISLYIGQAPTGIGAFKLSQYKNADIRYFNFSSPADTSLDYSVISNFLVIGTSKNTTRAILDYMSEK